MEETLEATSKYEEYDYEAERVEQAIALGYDPDLFTTSCIGSGVMYPDLWQVVKRYILRGDEYYQSGGLSILASTAWHMPLGEAATLLEEYFAKYQGCPVFSDGRGGINLTALSAAYAVATTYGWDGTDLEERKVRMLALLERCKIALARDGSADIASVEETIEAIRTDKSNFVPRYPEQIEGANSDGSYSLNSYNDQVNVSGETTLRGGSSIDAAATLAGPASISRKEVESLINQTIAELRRELPQPTLSQMDLIVVKHGYDMLNRDLSASEQRIFERINGIERRFDDRFTDLRADRQENLEKSQVRFGKWGVIIAIISLLVAGGTILLQFL